jgi:hypothetical protein
LDTEALQLASSTTVALVPFRLEVLHLLRCMRTALQVCKVLALLLGQPLLELTATAPLVTSPLAALTAPYLVALSTIAMLALVPSVLLPLLAAQA